MSFDEFLYSRFVKYIGKQKKVDDELLLRQVSLEEIKPKMTVFARALTGEAIDIFVAEREGGYKNTNFFLPESIALFPEKTDNLRYYLFRVMYLSVQRNLQLNWASNEEMPLRKSQQMAEETSTRVLQQLFIEYPKAIEIHQKLKKCLQRSAKENEDPDFTWLYGKWMRNELEAVGSQKQSSPLADKINKAAAVIPDTTLKANAVEEVIHIEIDKKAQEDYVFTHNFEKVETAEEFTGNWRDFDGADELEEHQDALDELNMKYTVRVDDAAHSVYQADFTENTTVLESSETNTEGFYISYDEWDFAKSCFKTDFCKLYPIVQQKTNADYYRKVITQNSSVLVELRKMLASVNNKYQQIRNQTQGEHIDIDAITDMYVDVHSGRTPSEKIYLSKRKIEKDISILLLLDNSLSADSYVAGERVIDVEKQVSILFGEILNEYSIDFSIASFSSKTRNHSSFNTLKDFEESWNTAKYKIGAIEPNGYTRIGTSIRHAGAMLENRPAKNKWLILISDGKPNDYDKYEGRYGVNDVKHSLQELSDKRINAFALAIEAQARYYLPQMFGQNHYQILTSPIEMLKALVRLYEKIKHQS